MSKLKPGVWFYNTRKQNIENTLNNKVNSALKELGIGMHPLQDIDAHGNFGVGQPGWSQHLWNVDNDNRIQADNRNYDWVDSTKRALIASDNQVRWNSTQTASINYLNEFIRLTGFKP